MNKLDSRLFNSVITSMNGATSCFIYVSDYERAREILSKRVSIISEFPFINILYVSGDIRTIYSVSKLECVKFISSHSKVSALVNIAKKAMDYPINNLSGKNVGICFIDTGIQPHLDFCFAKNRIIKFVDLINHRQSPYDDNGHGTFVSGVCSGNGLISNKKYQGFAPNSNIISIKALDKNGEATANKILEAMQWVYTNYQKYNIRVVCMSFGSEPLGHNDPIMKGAETLWRSGICVVAAAGNSGPEYETIKSPGISSKIITVGGINDNRFDDETFNPNFFEIAYFSSRGPSFRRFKPDLVAPSVDISSCHNKKGFYTKLSGTSVATPMIAGVCALAYEKNTRIMPDFLKKLLLQSCYPISFNKNFEGFGLLNIEKFLNKV